MWQRVSERTATLCIITTIKPRGGSVMVRACSGQLQSQGFAPDEGQIESDYHSILQHHAIPSGIQLVNQGFVLMQDNDPRHTDKFSQRYIKSKEE